MTDVRSGSWPVVVGYRIVAEIGRGGFASVYEAVQESVGRRVALKVLSTASTDAEIERRFRAECRTIGELSWHPHVVALYDAGLTVEGRPYMAMELLSGGSLADAVKTSGPLDADRVIQVGIEIADALSAAHGAGVIHRDVKPANILIGRRGEYLLGDFGIATVSDVTQSATGSFSGTYAYCAPEVHKGHRAGPQSDVFSLGASLYTLLTGQPPFTSRTDDAPSAVILRVVSEPAAPLPTSIQPELVAVIEQSMSKNPADRYQDGSEMGDALKAARPSTSGVDSPRAATAQAPPTSSPQFERAAPTDELESSTQARDAPTVARVQSSAVHLGTNARANARRPARGPHGPKLVGLVALSVALVVTAAGIVFWLRSTPNEVIATIDVGGIAAVVAATDDAVWVTKFSGGVVARINPATNEVTATIDVGKDVAGLAITDDAVWASSFINGDGSVWRIDPTTNKVTATISVGEGAFLLAATHDAVWVTSTYGTVSRIDPTTNKVIARVDVGQEAGGVAATDDDVWVTNPSNTTVSRIDPTTNKVIAVIDVGEDADEIAATDDAVWVTDSVDGTVSRIDPTTNKVIETIHDVADPGSHLAGLAATDDAVWVTKFSGGVARINPATNRVSAETVIEGSPVSVAVAEDAVWVLDSTGGVLSRVAP